MRHQSVARLLLAFVAALVLATVWGSIVQTQYNVAALGSMGVDTTIGLRTGMTLRDIFSGFTPTYGGYIVLPSLLVAFIVAWFVSSKLPGIAMLWFTLAGTLAIALGNPIVNFLSPLALLVGATRDVTCTLLMAVGGGLAGLLFAWLAWPDGRSTAGHRRVTNGEPAPA